MLKWVTSTRCVDATTPLSSSTNFRYQEFENEDEEEEHLEINDAERLMTTTVPAASEAELKLDAERHVALCDDEEEEEEEEEQEEDGGEEEVTVKDEEVEDTAAGDKPDIDDFVEVLELDAGSDPVSQSKGSKVYNRTLWLTEQIEREQKLRAGAEKLLRAASSKRIQTEIAVELRIANGNLQSMRDELSDIVSTVAKTSDIHQQSKRPAAKTMSPMIPFGLKETNYIDYQLELKDFISRHYHEDFENYRYDLNCLTDMRKACCRSMSGEEGLETLFTYYNQLYFVDRRFFPANTNGPVSFHWYDAFTGLPYVQKTVGFEKGCVLFNIAVLYAQKASKLKLKDASDLTEAIEDFQRSAGTFQYLGDNFLHAPSVDMQTPSIALLVQLALAQAYECRLELQMAADDNSITSDVVGHVDLAQEAAVVASMYSKALSMMASGVLRDVIPPLWLPMATCKQRYHKALGHYHVAMALTVAMETDVLYCAGALIRVDARQGDMACPDQMVEDEEGRKSLAKAHLRQSILDYEEALRIVAKQHKFNTFHPTLKTGHDRSLIKFSVVEEEDDFSEIPTAPDIIPKTRLHLHPILPDFSRYKVEDLFHRLGCIAIFSARHLWTMPRKVTLTKRDGEEFGFSIRGDSPVIVATVDDDSLAQKSGMLVGDFIISVTGVDIKWTKHDRVVAMIKSCGDLAVLHLVTPIDQNYIDPTRPPPVCCGTPQMTFESPSMLEPARESEKELASDRTEKSKGRPSSASWKLRARNSRSKADRESIVKDKDSSKDKGNSKDMDRGSSKDKSSTKDKDGTKDKVSSKDKDKGNSKDSAKDKGSSKDSAKDKGSSKDSAKDKGSSRRSPFSNR